MGLEVSDGLFGDRNPLIDEGERAYDLSRPQRHKRIVMPGWAVIGSATFIAGGLQNYKREQGFATTFHLMNESGASRNITVVIENLTTGETLVSGNVDLADGAFTNQAFSWSLEKIRPGDSIKFTIGNEGIGTANSNGTYVWSCSAHNFKAANQAVGADLYTYTEGYGSEVEAEEADVRMRAPVFLPHGAVITAAKVYGDASAAAEFWKLVRAPLNTGAYEDIASADINVEDTSISNATVDNSVYCYYFTGSRLDNTDIIYGARIIYTLADRPNSTSGYYEFELNGFFKSDGESSNE